MRLFKFALPAFVLGMLMAVGSSVRGQHYAPPVSSPHFASSSSLEMNEVLRRLEALEAKNGITTGFDDSVCKQVDILEKPSVTLTGRMHIDHVMFDEPPSLGDRENETGFDTVRLGAKGKVYENVAYRVQVEFEGDEVDYKDVFIDYLWLSSAGGLRVGHYKEPFSLEQLTSSRFITFMERSLPHNAFVPERNWGLMLYLPEVLGNKNLGVYSGVFRNNSDDSPSGSTTSASGVVVGADDNDWSWTTRSVWLPWYDESNHGRCMMHVGGAYSARRTLGSASFTPKPELGQKASAWLKASVARDDWELYGLEAAWVRGPFSVQGEYYGVDAGPADYYGGYVQLSYFLTGESRGESYKRNGHVFDRIKPYEPVFLVCTADGVCYGKGAIEAKFRWSHLDLSDVGGSGIQNNYGVGFNWYLNNYTRMMFDYIFEDVDLNSASADQGSLAGLRFQVDF